MSFSISFSTSCPCLVERAMMPPPIGSEGYYTAPVEPTPEQLKPEPVIDVHHPSLLTVKHDLHEEIVRIFSNTSKPVLPPFVLPTSPLHSIASRSYADSSMNTVPSRRDSFDSLMATPALTNTPADFSTHRRSSVYRTNSTDSAKSFGLGFTGLSKQDGTPFDGYGILQPVSYAKDRNYVPTQSFFGLGLYGEDHSSWQWSGEPEVIFDADGDTTLVDAKIPIRRSSRRSTRQSQFSPPGLSKAGLSSELERLFDNLTAKSSSSFKPEYRSTPKHGNGNSETVSSRSFSWRSNIRRMEHKPLTSTVPLPPSTPDVFYDSSVIPSSTNPTNQAGLESAQRLRLCKEERELSWSLPPVSMKPKKAKL
ncbi:hypothetical protein BXZ70DRAFT_92594 [Cristinia sonorae]|uniref:Uncharacterized protein n=1 Tax=Cristinia sonorae TaxID=1940300 RepID=A0A8K0US67_9AGAR|nr:hypothetical protein BXZ70DRAFT_92594 [Cristinia sonorae]